MEGDRALSLALRTLPELAAHAPRTWSITPLGGITNRVFRLQAADKDYVLRIGGAAARHYVRREDEIRNAQTAAALGLTPAILRYVPGQDLLLMRYISDARPLTPVDLREKPIRLAASQLLARLQNSACIFSGQITPFEIATTYADFADDPALHDLIRRGAALRGALLPLHQRLVPSHVDPHAANFLLCADGGLFLVDWEFSAMSLPFWDLAALSLDMMDDEAAEIGTDLLRGYLGRPFKEREYAQFALVRTALHLVAGSWALAEARLGNKTPGLVDFARNLLEHFAKIHGGKALAEWIAAS